MSKQIIWLSYDLGLRGDHEGLYAWLDKHGAKECGDGLAFLHFEHDGETLPEKVKEELSKSVTLDKRSRVYVIWRDGRKMMKGRFIFGSRRASPWAGMAPGVPTADDEA